MAALVCPVWVGYFLACPLRKLFQNPHKILQPYVHEGMKVLDVGCAMGFFSLPLARLVGPEGMVFCVDLQEKMIRSLEKRARKAGLAERIKTQTCFQDSLDLEDLAGTLDFALAMAVVHEVPDASGFFSEIAKVLQSGGQFLLAEPKGHVSKTNFKKTTALAASKGLTCVEDVPIRWSHAVLLSKK